jgi:hypothetical protein
MTTRAEACVFVSAESQVPTIPGLQTGPEAMKDLSYSADAIKKRAPGPWLLIPVLCNFSQVSPSKTSTRQTVWYPVGTSWIFVKCKSQWHLRSHHNYNLHPNVLTRGKLWLQLLATPQTHVRAHTHTHTHIHTHTSIWSGKTESSLFCSIQTFGIFMLQIFYPRCQFLFYFSFCCQNKHTSIFHGILPNGTSHIFVNHIHTNPSLTLY